MSTTQIRVVEEYVAKALRENGCNFATLFAAQKLRAVEAPYKVPELRGQRLARWITTGSEY